MISILDALQNGKSGMKNAKFAEVAKSMQWRQKYLGAEIYPITLDDGRTLNFKQVENGETSGLGTGAIVWPAAHVLSKYMELKYRSEKGMDGMRVCDIGSGTGCTGFIAAALGATESVLTDQECIFFLMEDNKQRVCQENPTIDPAKISLKLYDWGESPSHLAPPFDLVIISDCILPKLYPIEPLVKVRI